MTATWARLAASATRVKSLRKASVEAGVCCWTWTGGGGATKWLVGDCCVEDVVVVVVVVGETVLILALMGDEMGASILFVVNDSDPGREENLCRLEGEKENWCAESRMVYGLTAKKLPSPKPEVTGLRVVGMAPRRDVRYGIQMTGRL